MTISLAAARAAASRRNGARSRGPKTPDGKARAAQNALKHGLRAQKFVVVGDEKAADFAALEAALLDELAPEGALQGLLAGRIARAAWRLERAERIEAELFAREIRDNDLGLALIRDGNGAGAFGTLLRYRGGALAELWRALRLLEALQAEAAPADQTPHDLPLLAPRVDTAAAREPIEPEADGNPGELPAPAAAKPGPDVPDTGGAATDPAAAAFRRHGRKLPPRENPIEPEARGNPDEICSPSVVGPGIESFSGRRDAEPPEAPAARPGHCDRTVAPGHAGVDPQSRAPEGERERAAVAARRIR